MILRRTLLSLLILIFVGVVFHAPLSVFIGSLLPEWQLEIKAWKEVLLFISLILVAVAVTQQKKWHHFASDWVVRIVAAYVLLHILLLPFMWQGGQIAFAALIINLRFTLFFLVVYIAYGLYPHWRRPILTASLVAAAVSLLFAVLQVTILPNDVLSHIGYSKETIAPYLTVDQNHDYVRINGTLRGPNPLGVYATIVFACCASVLLTLRHALARRNRWLPWFVGGLGVASLVAVWFSYSRSALIGLFVAVLIILIVRYGKRVSKVLWVAFGLVALLSVGGVYLMRDTAFISNVVLHEDPEEGGDINSNDGHWKSLVEGVERAVRQPLGAGVGSTGSPSLMGDTPFIMENQYLYIAHETGWLGLAVFLVLFGILLKRLWQRRSDWLSLGLLASGVGAAVACLFLPVWADDTVSLVWWGLAGVALSAPLVIKKRSGDGKAIK